MQVALVTPSFNRAPTLAATLRSVAAQTGNIDLRYVVIDGGSTDATLDILKAHDSIIDDWVSEPDKGMYDAIAKGFARSGGEVLGWLNSDDTLFPWAIDTVSRIFRDIPEIQWLTTLTQTAIDAAGDVMYFRKVPGYAQQAFFDGVYFGFGGDGGVYSTDFIQQESTFFRRSLWEKVGAAALASRPLAGDFALWTAFMAEAPLVAVDTPLGAFRVHSGSQLSRGKREQYVGECASALAEARARLKYTPRTTGTEAVQYSGYFVEKILPEDGDSRWGLTERPFFVLPKGDLKSAIQRRAIY
ncbi:MAG: glycosyltransferase family 2 protein [Rhodospirillaceae bacterium]|nr:glycosyltransferase family 2 protein [Rhodospirillaceae bacterium]